MQNNVAEILEKVVGELKQMARAETVLGQPITLGDKTVVPIVSIAVGFGAGGGQGEQTTKLTGFGGGGGGGAKIEPAGFIIIDKDGVAFLPAKRGSWEGIINTIPGVIEKLVSMRSSARKTEETTTK